MATKFTVEQSVDHLRTNGCDGLTIRQLAMLGLLRRGGRMTVRETASLLDLPKSNVTRNATKFVERGWLRRIVDHTDRRSIFMELTAAGQKFANQVF